MWLLDQPDKKPSPVLTGALTCAPVFARISTLKTDAPLKCPAPLLSAFTAQAGIVDLKRVVDEVDNGALILGLHKAMQGPNATVAIHSDTDQHALKAEDTLVKHGYFGIVNGGNYEELQDAPFAPVSRPDNVLPGNKPTDDPTAIN